VYVAGKHPITGNIYYNLRTL